MTSHGAICGSSAVDRHLHFVALPSDKITRGALQLQLRSGNGIQLEEVHLLGWLFPKRSDNTNESHYETESTVSFAATSCGRGRASSLETSISGAEDANLKLPLIPIAIINLWLLCRVSPMPRGLVSVSRQHRRRDGGGWIFAVRLITYFVEKNRLTISNPVNGQRAPSTHKVAGYIEGF